MNADPRGTDRRRFLRNTALVAIASFVVRPFQAFAETNTAPYSYNSWIRMPGQNLSVSSPVAVTLRLDSVTRGTAPRPGGDNFTLVFTGPASPALKQSTVRMYHQMLGTFDLLLVPGTSTSTTRRYTAMVNRLTAA